MKIMHTSVWKLAALAVLGASTLLGSAVSADAKPNATGSEMRGEGRRRGGAKMQGLAKLNLSEAQKAQIKTIRQSSRTDMQAVKANTSLTPEQKRAQLKTIHTNARNAVDEVLTPSQRAQLAQMKTERKANRQERKAARGEKMAQKLNLSESQRSQIASIRSRAQGDVQVVKSNTSLSREDKRAQLKTIRTNAQNAIADILTPAQLQQWQAMKAERKERKAGRKESRQANRAERKSERQANRNNGLNN